MKPTATNHYTFDHQQSADGTVTFACSTDQTIWPWLALHPHDPIAIQIINYYAAVETGDARGTMDPTKWSALTHTSWTCGAADAGHAVRGIARPQSADAPDYDITLFDQYDAQVCQIRGTGVVFENRDFESWRAAAKRALSNPVSMEDFDYAAAADAGAASQLECFISPLEQSDPPSVSALIVAANGFTPFHPTIGGSGDHVNSAHLADTARQFVQLLRGGTSVRIDGGEMQFDRYVELDHPFRLQLQQSDHSADRLTMSVHQAGKPCATISLHLADETAG